MDTELQALTAAWLAERSSEHTRAAYSRDLGSYETWCRDAGCDPLTAGPNDLEQYRDGCLAEGLSAATVSRRLSAIASFFRHAVAVGATAANPSEHVEHPVPPISARPSLGDDELDQLIDAARQLGAKPAALVALLALDGLKLNEALAVNVPHVRLGEPASIRVARHGRLHDVPIGVHSAELVGAYIATRRRGPLFLGESATGTRPGRLTRFGADYLIKRASAAAELDKLVSANVLRRSYIESARRSGASLADIAQQVGHRETREVARLLDK